MMMLKGDYNRLLLSCWCAPLLWLLALQAWGGGVDARNPYRLMQQLAHRTFERIHQEQRQKTHDDDDNTLRIIVRQELMPFVHIRYTGALILGPLFNTLDAEQQQRYFQTLEVYLEQSYAQILKSYRHHDYQIEPEKLFADRTIVTVRLSVLQTGSAPLRVDFKWRKNSKNQQWQLYDILVEGVSLIATKQQEWTALLRRSGFDALIEELNKEAKPSITPGKANY
jgi:phospholipid transport system substrate-binding protein